MSTMSEYYFTLSMHENNQDKKWYQNAMNAINVLIQQQFWMKQAVDKKTLSLFGWGFFFSFVIWTYFYPSNFATYVNFPEPNRVYPFKPLFIFIKTFVILSNLANLSCPVKGKNHITHGRLLVRVFFPALFADYMYLFRDLNGLFKCRYVLWLASSHHGFGFTALARDVRLTLMAFCKFCSVLRTTVVSRLNRISSCLSTVFMDSS